MPERSTRPTAPAIVLTVLAGLVFLGRRRPGNRAAWVQHAAPVRRILIARCWDALG